MTYTPQRNGRYYCSDCGTEVSGTFASCPLCTLKEIAASQKKDADCANQERQREADRVDQRRRMDDYHASLERQERERQREHDENKRRVEQLRAKEEEIEQEIEASEAEFNNEVNKIVGSDFSNLVLLMQTKDSENLKPEIIKSFYTSEMGRIAKSDFGNLNLNMEGEKVAESNADETLDTII